MDVHQPVRLAGLDVHGSCTSASPGPASSAVRDPVKVKGFAHCHEGPCEGGRAPRGFLDSPEGEGDSSEVDHVVGEHGADDLPAQGMRLVFGSEAVHDLRGE